jgi:hypothetical protein
MMLDEGRCGHDRHTAPMSNPLLISGLEIKLGQTENTSFEQSKGLPSLMISEHSLMLRHVIITAYL